jgi:hypothetical protein
VLPEKAEAVIGFPAGPESQYVGVPTGVRLAQLVKPIRLCVSSTGIKRSEAGKLDLYDVGTASGLLIVRQGKEGPRSADGSIALDKYNNPSDVFGVPIGCQTCASCAMSRGVGVPAEVLLGPRPRFFLL